MGNVQKESSSVNHRVKVCKKCTTELPLEEFRVATDTRGYKYTFGTCKSCYREKQKLQLREYRRVRGNTIQARHRERLANDPDYRERKRLAASEKYKRQKERKLNYQRRYRQNNREKVRELDKNKRYKKLYGITLAEFRELFASQGRRCAICGKSITNESDAKVDHCHTGDCRTRGILCSTCNLGLGAFKDSQAILLSAVQYLIKHHGVEDATTSVGS